jgi:autotransporter-associated beta strand protein
MCDFSRGRSFCVAILSACALLIGARSTIAQRVLGADISYWNRGSSSATSNGISQSNFNTAFATGNIKFVFIRATRGGTTGVDQGSGTYGNPDPPDETLSRRYDDPDFLRNINRATTAGMLASPYHFDRADIAGNTGLDEANHFIEMAGAFMRPGYLLPVLDLEAGSGLTRTELSNWAIEFAERINDFAGVRPIIYANSSYVNDEVNSSVATAMPNLWIARPSGADPLTTEPPPAAGYPNVYGFWNPSYPTIPDPEPWEFWQYTITSIAGFNAVDSSVDANVAHGDIEWVRDFLVPAMWRNDSNGDWSTLTNWNSGQPTSTPITPPDQSTPYLPGPVPTPRLPGAAGSGPTSGQYDTVVLERTGANVTVTISTGTHNIRKMYMRETLNITGGSLTINYDPNYNFNVGNPDALRSGPISAQFSGAVTLSGSGSLNVNTLQVDATRTFTLAGSSGTLTFKQINLMPHSTTPAKISVTGNVNINPLSNGTATISNGSGAGSTGFVDFGGGSRTFNVGNGSANVDLDVAVPITNGSLTKSGAGTMRLSGSNTFSAATISGGVLRTNHSSALTNSMAVTVNNGGTLDLNGITETIASLASAAGNTTGAVLQGAANLTLSASSGTFTYGGTITSSGTLAKNGASTQTLTGNNSLGPVTISAGKLLFNGSNTTGNITVTTNGVLGGTGSVSGAVTLNNFGHLAPGASIESFDVGALTLNTGSVLDFDLGAGGVMDRINVAGLLTIVGASVNLTDTGGMSAGLYTLVDYGTVSGNVAGLGTPNGPSTFKYSLFDTGSTINLRVSILGDFNFDNKVDAADYVVWRKGLGTTYTAADYNLWRAHHGEVAGAGSGVGAGPAVPEPATAALLFVAFLTLVFRRRRAQ